MKKCLNIIVSISILCLLCACQSIKLPKGSDYTTTDIPQAITTATSLPSLNIPLSTPLKIISTQRIFPTANLTSTVPIQVGPTQTVIPQIMCSPLISETLVSIWEIISYPYNNPPPGREDMHHGVDFAYYRRGNRLSIDGETIQSMLPGVVSAAIEDRLPYGNMVMIETEAELLPAGIAEYLNIHPGESLYSLYAHMGHPPQLSLGDPVRCGQFLGTVGKTGYDIANQHLHLEMRIGPAEKSFASIVFYDTSATLEEMENYLLWRTSGVFRHLDPMGVIAQYLTLISPGFQTPTP